MVYVQHVPLREGPLHLRISRNGSCCNIFFFFFFFLGRDDALGYPDVSSAIIVAANTRFQTEAHCLNRGRC